METRRAVKRRQITQLTGLPVELKTELVQARQKEEPRQKVIDHAVDAERSGVSLDSVRHQNSDTGAQEIRRNSTVLKAEKKGTGDTIVQAQIGSHADDNSRWAMECHDGEAVIGFQDYGYISLSTMWCKFMFPKKKMNGGYYPYYDYCNVRDVQVMKEYYCYDKYYPVETYDTFVTGYVYASGYTVHAGSIYPALYASNAESYKCCKLPHGYHLDYSRCQYHYSHDKFGEHYGDANMFVMRCDRDFLMTGIGKAETPWDDYMRYVWVQCCPLFYDTAYVPLWATANATLHARAQRRHYSSPSSYGSHGRTDEQPTKIINVS